MSESPEKRKGKDDHAFFFNVNLTRLPSLAILLLIFSSNGYSQEKDSASISMMFYNAENFFDTHDDTLKNDNDFLPDGLMRWNYSRYVRKLNSVYRVIAAAGEWSPPVIIGLCEVENRKVLQALVNDTYLSKFSYGIVHHESNDLRGIDVGIIYRKDAARLLHEEVMIPRGYDPGEFKTRNILYTVWLISGDTLHLFMNHWPSRRGGVLPGESTRQSIAEMLREKADSVTGRRGGRAKIIIAGDFNCTPDDLEMKRLTGRREGDSESDGLVNLSEELSSGGAGTYKYRGVWEMLDQVIVSEQVINAVSGLSAGKDAFRIFEAEFLLRKDPGYPGSSTFPTYLGYRYLGGFSDHLPVILELKIR